MNPKKAKTGKGEVNKIDSFRKTLRQYDWELFDFLCERVRDPIGWFNSPKRNTIMADFREWLRRKGEDKLR